MTDERTSIDMRGTLSELTFPEVGEGSLVIDLGSRQTGAQPKDLFAVNKRKSWDKTVEARCDFTYKLIKGDPDMVTFFADNITPVISETLGYHLADGSWAICTSPKRRHKEKNFATLISERIAASLGIPFYEDVAMCHSKQRVNAVFEANNIPHESNIIVFDDFVTTGQTLAAMKKLLDTFNKNVTFFSAINNKL